MTFQSVVLEVNEDAVELTEPFPEGHTVVFTSTSFNPDIGPDAPTDNTNLNITHGLDYLIHISFRRDRGRIVLNTKINQRWGEEEIIPLPGIFTGGFPTVAIVNTKEGFNVVFDNRKAYLYRHRDERLGTGLLYQSNDDSGGIFSNPIYAQVYPAALHDVPEIEKDGSKA